MKKTAIEVSAWKITVDEFDLLRSLSKVQCIECRWLDSRRFETEVAHLISYGLAVRETSPVRASELVLTITNLGRALLKSFDLKVADVDRTLLQIESFARDHDFEAASEHERQLHADVLLAVAAHTQDTTLRELATKAVASRGIKFPRVSA